MWIQKLSNSICYVLLLLLTAAAFADSGSSQANMALIVPPHDPTVMSEQQPDPAMLSQPYYNHDFTLKLNQQQGSQEQQVWISL